MTSIDSDWFTISSIQTSNTDMLIKLSEVIKYLELVNDNITLKWNSRTSDSRTPRVPLPHTLLHTHPMLLVDIMSITATIPMEMTSMKNTLVLIIAFLKMITNLTLLNIPLKEVATSLSIELHNIEHTKVQIWTSALILELTQLIIILLVTVTIFL